MRPELYFVLARSTPHSACCTTVCHKQIVPIAARLVVHLLLRTIPTVLICVGLYVVLLAQFIVIHDDDLAASCSGEVR